MPSITNRPLDPGSPLSPGVPGWKRTVPPARNARLIMRKALFCPGSIASCGPDPVILPAGAWMPAATALASKPTSGMLSITPVHGLPAVQSPVVP